MVKKVKKAVFRKLDEAHQRVLEWFFAYPTKWINLSDLAKEVEVSKSTASAVVNYLIEVGFLKKEVLGKTWRISCEQEHPFNVIRKIPYNLQKVYESGVIQSILQKVDAGEIPNPQTIILFGSYRQGVDDETSDVDVAVEVVDNKDLRVIKLMEISKMGYRKNVPVNLHIFSRNRIDLNLFANIANGIVLQGFLEVRI
ncbi:MAG TPA: hypothetical protein ENN60_01815 [archaeon]|nr:hypothetical protein [archaeon]